MANGAVSPLEALKNWGNDFDTFARKAYSWLLLHYESNSSEAAIAGISHTRPQLRQRIAESLASHERVNRTTRKKGAVDQTYPNTIKSEVDFWSQEAITKGINNTRPVASAIADIPRTRQQQAMYIQEMFDALKSTQGIIEEASNVKVGIVKSTSGRVFQDIAWVLYVSQYCSSSLKARTRCRMQTNLIGFPLHLERGQEIPTRQARCKPLVHLIHVQAVPYLASSVERDGCFLSRKFSHPSSGPMP